MSIYEAKGVTNGLLYLYDGEQNNKLSAEPFEFVKEFPALEVPEEMDIEEYKKTKAPYCISGKVKKDKKGTYRRNDSNLIYRDLIFLDYDNITITSEEFKATVERAIGDYSYIIYPTIKHTEEKPRFRLVVKPSKPMDKETYKAVVTEIADKIGLEYDTASLTWSQLARGVHHQQPNGSGAHQPRPQVCRYHHHPHHRGHSRPHLRLQGPILSLS